MSSLTHDDVFLWPNSLATWSIADFSVGVTRKMIFSVMLWRVSVCVAIVMGSVCMCEAYCHMELTMSNALHALSKNTRMPT